MAKRRKKLPSDTREVRAKIAKLKRKGLAAKNKDVRTIVPNAYWRGVIKKHEDVLEGKATVLSRIKSAFYKFLGIKTHEQLEEKFTNKKVRVRGKHVIVKHATGEDVRWNKKTGKLVRYSMKDGKRVKSAIQPTNTDFKSLEGKGVHFTMRLGDGSYKLTFDNWDELVAEMEKYEKTFPKWREFVEVEVP